LCDVCDGKPVRAFHFSGSTVVLRACGSHVSLIEKLLTVTANGRRVVWEELN